MKGQFYRIDWDTCDRLGLYGREAMVYCALIYLCKKAPYTGSATDLADFSHCGKKMTALRMLSSLQQKELICISKDGITLAQIEPSSDQIETVSAQVETIPKEEKENQKKKENIKKETNRMFSFSACEEKKAASPEDLIFNRIFNMDVLFPGDKPKIPANTGYYKIIVLEYGYMNPKSFVDEFYNYWDGQGWPERGNKLSLMRSWMDRYMRMKGAKKPNLNDIERAVMKTFLDHIEERLIVRLMHVVKQFEVTEQKIIFYVPDANTEDFVLWLNSLPLSLWFEAYHRGVSVRPLKIP